MTDRDMYKKSDNKFTIVDAIHVYYNEMIFYCQSMFYYKRMNKCNKRIPYCLIQSLKQFP